MMRFRRKPDMNLVFLVGASYLGLERESTELLIWKSWWELRQRKNKRLRTSWMRGMVN
jgi:hypothetical protein